MTDKKMIIHEAKGKITLIEMHSLGNCLPVKDETYSRIIYGLMVAGYIKLPGQKGKIA